MQFRRLAAFILAGTLCLTDAAFAEIPQGQKYSPVLDFGIPGVEDAADRGGSEKEPEITAPIRSGSAESGTATAADADLPEEYEIATMAYAMRIAVGEKKVVFKEEIPELKKTYGKSQYGVSISSDKLTAYSGDEEVTLPDTISVKVVDREEGEDAGRYKINSISISRYGTYKVVENGYSYYTIEKQILNVGKGSFNSFPPDGRATTLDLETVFSRFPSKEEEKPEEIKVPELPAETSQYFDVLPSVEGTKLSFTLKKAIPSCELTIPLEMNHKNYTYQTAADQPSVALTVKVTGIDAISLNYAEKSLAPGATCLLQVNEIIPRNEVVWSSSNAECVAVDANGTVSALQNGTAVVTASWKNCKAECTVTVSGSGSGNPTVSEEDSVTNNVGKQNYSTYAATVNSYLMDNHNGTLTRVEALKDKVLVEICGYDGSVADRKVIEMELPLFGGFFSGDQYNFLVFGQTNPAEDNNREVIRVVRYTKDWQRDGAARLCGANTVDPFGAGSLRVTQYDNRLYVRTCHRMYKSSDGLNHQANIMMNINIDTMWITDSYTEVSNSAYGYVSHSFNQFVATDGSKVIAADHGDAYPRSVVLFRYKQEAGQDKLVSKGCDRINVLKIKGETGDNTTGASVGGLVVTGSSYLVAGNSVNQEDTSTGFGGVRNIFVTSTSKDDFSEEGTRIHWITNYSGSEKISTPQIVKIDDDKVLLLFMVEDTLNYVYLNGTGNPITPVYEAYGRLSDCVPVVVGEEVIWYYTERSTPRFCRLGGTLGEITLNADSMILKSEATFQLMLNEVVPIHEVTWTSSDPSAVSVDARGKIEALSNGTSVIKATWNGLEAACKVVAIDHLTLNYTSRTMNVGDTLQLKVNEGIPSSDVSWQIAYWSSYDGEKCISLSKTGRIKALQQGSAMVMVYWNGLQETCRITVTKASSSSGGSGSSGGGGGGSSGGGGGSSGGGGGGSSSGGRGGSSSKSSGSGLGLGLGVGADAGSLPSYVVRGSWTQSGDTWFFTDSAGTAYKNRWAAVYNPYANTAAGQSNFDWFWFDADGRMLTGWHLDADGNYYYLNPASDGTRGKMVIGWAWIADASGVQRCYYFNPNSDGTRGKKMTNTVIDGYQLDANGYWVVNGVVQTR